jgi:hypothetical protein
MQITRHPSAKRPAARPPTPPSITPVKRRAAPPGKPRVKKQGLRPFLKAAGKRVRLLRGETFLGQVCAVSAFIIVMCGMTYAGIQMANETRHQAGLLLAVNRECAEPRPLSHVMACEDFACLASVNKDNGRFVRLCHPEALRS